jgi:hypothetical protein
VIAHAAAGRYRFSAKARGFQDARAVETALESNGLTTLFLTRAHATRGVIGAPDGTPIAGATLRPLAKYKPQMSYNYANSEPVMATTGKDGRFTLDALDDDTAYTFLIETDTFGREVVSGVRAGQGGLKWTVGPNATITGTLKGELGALAKERGKPIVELTQRVKDGAEGGLVRTLALGSTAPVEPIPGGGRFRFSGILPGEVDIKAGEHVVRVDIEKPDNVVTIELATPLKRPTTRPVIVRIVAPDGAVKPEGSVGITASEGNPGALSRLLEAPLKAGEARFEILTPGRFQYRSEKLVGYWFKSDMTDVPPGDEAFVVEVEAVPAGAIVGRVIRADGVATVDGASISARAIAKPPGLQNEPISLDNVHVDTKGQFFIGPLPIGGSYVAIANLGHNKQVSQEVRLDGAKAVERVEIRLATPVAARVRVTGPDGRPLAGVPVSLQLDHPLAGTTWGPPEVTRVDGRIEFNDLSSELGVYRVSLDLRKDYQPASAVLNLGGPLAEIRLERGHVVRGRVVDATTGWPIPGVVLYAQKKDWKPGERFAFEAEAETDKDGRFRFSNLPAEPVLLRERNGLA